MAVAETIGIVLPSGHPRSGFTLIEIMVTVLIVLAGLAGIMMMAQGSTKAGVESMNFNRATAYGEELLEQMREERFANLEAQANVVSGTTCAAAGNPPWDVPASSTDQTDQDTPVNTTDVLFAREVRVECLSATMKRVIVKVTWDDATSVRRGAPHSVQFETFRTPDPL